MCRYVCVCIRGIWPSWWLQWTLGTFCSFTPACCLRDAFSSTAVNSAQWVWITSFKPLIYSHRITTRFVCSFSLRPAYTRVTECSSPCTGNTSSFPSFHRTCSTTAGEDTTRPPTHYVSFCVDVCYISWVEFMWTSRRYFSDILFHLCSAPMPYLIGVHSSLAEVQKPTDFFLSHADMCSHAHLLWSVFGFLCAVESEESSFGGRGHSKRGHKHPGVTLPGPEKDPSWCGETLLYFVWLMTVNVNEIGHAPTVHPDQKAEFIWSSFLTWFSVIYDTMLTGFFALSMFSLL